MALKVENELNRSLLVLAITGALVACGGGSSGSDSDDHEDDHTEEEHEHAGARLIYSLSDDSGLNMYDQTVEEAEAFQTDVVATSVAGATLVLSTSGLTAAVLDNGAVSILDSGLEHLADEDGHTHDVSANATSLTSGITAVVATHEYFSAYDGMTSTVIDAETGEAVTAPDSDAYPTLALTGGHFLTFNGIDGGVEMEVVEPDGESLETPVTMTCATGSVLTSAQTEHLTQVLCSNGALLSLIAGEGEAETVFTTVSEADSGLNRLTATASAHDVIAGWNTDSKVLKLFNVAGSDVQSVDVTAGIASSLILDVAALTSDEHDVLGVLGSDGKFFALSFHVEESGAEVENSNAFALASGQTWSAQNKVLADSEAFIVVNTDNQTLYFIDGHEGGDYHLHSSLVGDASLASLSDAVLAHVGESHDEEGHEEEGHDH